jgi:ferric-dicitrate binding protein FerR (iron transport regulator)
MAYPDEEMIETSLIDGKVELHMMRHDGKLIPLVQMKPAELAVFQVSTDEINVRTISDDRYFAWKDGKLVFNKEPIGRVVEKLSRWFNVDIQIEDQELLHLTYTATFVDETLPQVLELISMVTPVSYSISNRQMVSPGIFSKRKVILSYRNK